MEPLETEKLTPVGGFAAITPKMPTGPLAITKVIMGEDGQPRTIYVDARTGQELSGLGGYSVWNSQNYYDPDLKEDKDDTPAKKVIEDKDEPEPREIGRGGRNDSGFAGYQTEAGSQFHSDSGDDSPRSSRLGNDERHNYGYINKPTGMGFANMLPGPLGMAAKIANTGINMNNVSAVNEARSRIGLEDQGFMGRLGGTLKDKQGQVADVTIGDANYSVGFEAQSPTGRTNMTPEEAAKRAQALGTTIKETPKEQVKEDEARFRNDFPKETGFLSDVKNTISSIFDAVNPFNDDKEERYTKDYFPDAPSKASGATSRGDRSYDGESYSGQNAGQDSPSERSGVGRGSQMRGGETGASTSEANRGGGGVTSGGGGLW